MHDPMTVAFEIPNPVLPRREVLGEEIGRPPLVTVWHVDPETDGTDDSCDWFGRDNPDRVIHPRWHVWHWTVQIHPIQHFKRWAFSRCCICGGRFRWGESPVSNSWHGDGPRWFRSESGVAHLECHAPYTTGGRE